MHLVGRLSEQGSSKLSTESIYSVHSPRCGVSDTMPRSRRYIHERRRVNTVGSCLRWRLLAFLTVMLTFKIQWTGPCDVGSGVWSTVGRHEIPSFTYEVLRTEYKYSSRMLNMAGAQMPCTWLPLESETCSELGTIITFIVYIAISGRLVVTIAKSGCSRSRSHL